MCRRTVTFRLWTPPRVAVRLRAFGWRPRPELEERAPYSEEAAAQLQQAEAVRERREERIRLRSDARAGSAGAEASPKHLATESTPAAKLGRRHLGKPAD